MVGVLEAVVLLGHVALGAEAVVVELAFERVGVVAVGTLHALVVHLALQERGVDVHLVEDLPVGVVQARLQERRLEVVEERVTGDPPSVVTPPAGVAGGAGVQELGVVHRREVRRAVAVAAVPEERVGLGQLDVDAPRPVARLAAHVDFKEGRVVGVGCQVVVLLQIGRVALGAHGVPVLGHAGPVQRVVGLEPQVDGIGWRDVEPLLLLDVPGDAQHLHAAAVELDHVLLKRPDAEGPLHLVVVVLAVGALGVHPVLVTLAEEAGSDPEAG